MAENVEVVQRVVDAINRADFDTATDVFSEDFELDFTNSRGPMSGIYRGREETQGFLASFFEPWAALHMDTEELVEIGDGRVLTVTEIRTRGQGSGVEVTATGAMLWTIRNGEVAAAKMYQSKDDALEAAAN